MARSRLAAGGGLAAILYVLEKARRVGPLKLYRRLRSRNTCKTCALGMGGQRGGMVNEAGHFPEICKKSVQAQAADMMGAIPTDYFQRTSIEEMSRLTSREFEELGRLTFPIVADANDTHFRRISWDEAYQRSARAFQNAHPDRVFFYSSGRASNEAAFLMLLVARAFGTTNINNCSFYCHQASGVALGQVYGSGTASITLDDMRQADLALVAGANPASNHPRLMTQLIDLRKRGGKVIVVNPLKELGLVRFRLPSQPVSLLFGSKIAHLYLQPHIGGDIATYKALLKGVIERGAIDQPYVDAHTAGWEAVRRDVEQSSWDQLIRESGVPRAELDRAVEMMVNAKRGVFLWAMGLTQHVYGVDNILALSNLALARGWLGRPGSGLLPIRGHSNVQGVGSMGVAPDLKKAFAAKLKELYQIDVSKPRGFDTHESLVAAYDGKIEGAFLLGGNLFASNPDRNWAGAAMRRIGLTLCLTTKLNEGHVHGRGQTTVIVPVLARDEEAQPTTQESMFNYVRLSDGGVPSVPGDFRSEVEVIASFAERVLPAGRFDWKSLRSHQRLREEVAKVVPGFKAIGKIDQTRNEFQIEGRTFVEPNFNTEDGKAHFAVTPVPLREPKDGEFRLMTLRSEGQFNTVVYEEEDVYRGNSRRDVVMISEEDGKDLGVKEGDTVMVRTEAAQLKAVVSFVEIRPRNIAMYYPEANVLVPQQLDPRSKTPAFKCVAARIETIA